MKVAYWRPNYLIGNVHDATIVWNGCPDESASELVHISRHNGNLMEFTGNQYGAEMAP